jgi:hypothetical protein
MCVFLPLKQMMRRVDVSRDDSDIAYFYDLVALGEMVTKFTTLFLVSNIEDDVERTRYRFEYKLVRADGIGDFASAISEISTGSAADYLSVSVRDKEVTELIAKSKTGSWQLDCLQKLDECASVLGFNVNQITSKSSVRIWFSNFSILRNKTKGHGTITAEQSALVSPLLRESIQIIIDNLSLFNRNWAFLNQNYSGKYNVAYIGRKTDEFDYLKRSKDYHLINGVYCYTDRPHKVNLFLTDLQLSSFYLVNGNFSSSSKYEMLDYLTNKKRVEDGSLYLSPPTKLPDSVTGGERQVVVTGESFTNLPLALQDYIHREELESELYKVLVDESRYPVVTLKGRGGIGKTSLAICVIDSVLRSDPGRFDIVIWFSARDVDLLQEGPKQVQAVVANQSDIAMEYFKQIGKDLSSKNITELFALELTKCSLGKALFIFDNFETLSNPVEVYEWLDSYIRLPNKILITSRLSRNFKADYPVGVKGMNDEQCTALIKTTASKLGIQSLLTDNYRLKLIEESDGHPYIIKIILGDVAKSNKLTEIKRIVADKDKVLDALFKRTYSTLSVAAKRVFLTLCSWRSVVPQIALESVILRDENEKMDFDYAIEELDKSSFIEINERFDDSFISVPLAASLFGSKELEVSPEKHLILRDKKLLMEFGAGTERGKATLKSHVNKKISAIKIRVNNYSQLEKEIPSLECLSSKYPLIWRDIASLYHQFGKIEKEKECYRELLKGEIDSTTKLDCWRELCKICCQDGDWKGESAALGEIIAIKDIPYREISLVAKRVNKYYSEHSDFDSYSKSKLTEDVMCAMESRIAEADAVDCSRLAWLCLNLQDEAKALMYAKRGLQLDPQETHCKKLFNKLASTKT